MKQSFSDIRSRIAEEPTWFDVYGVPRYGPEPEEMIPFIRTIYCQSCRKPFRVALVDEVYKGLYGKTYHIGIGDPCSADPKERHVKLEYMGMTERDPNSAAYRTIPRPLPEDWSYGDPPHHGDEEDGSGCCVGTTMSSVADYEANGFWDEPTEEELRQEAEREREWEANLDADARLRLENTRRRVREWQAKTWA